MSQKIQIWIKKKKISMIPKHIVFDVMFFKKRRIVIDSKEDIRSLKYERFLRVRFEIHWAQKKYFHGVLSVCALPAQKPWTYFDQIWYVGIFYPYLGKLNFFFFYIIKTFWGISRTKTHAFDFLWTNDFLIKIAISLTMLEREQLIERKSTKICHMTVIK